MKRYIVLIGILCLSGVVTLKAQQERNQGIIWSSLRGLEYTVKAGINIGGTAPVPLPREIRAIDSYRPTLCVSIEGDIKKWFGESKEWGMMIGLRLENKGMETKATVKNYSMEIIGSGGEKLKGNWTGGVRTKLRSSQVTIPLLATHKFGERWSVKLGPYFSYLMDGDFSGEVYEGYLREGNPTGQKIVFTDGAVATYDFHNDMNHFQWGVQAGADWKAFKHLKVFADLTWGLNDIFQKDFQTISFAMYPIYLNFGFGYAF